MRRVKQNALAIAAMAFQSREVIRRNATMDSVHQNFLTILTMQDGEGRGSRIIELFFKARVFTS